MAKCPKCGSPRAKYIVSRRKRWKGRSGSASMGSAMESRKNFKANCNKCGWKGTIP